MSAPARVQARPDPSAWDMDELMSLPEAAALFWPAGPLSTHSLRVAVRDGALPVTIVAGKILTTRRSVLSLSVCRPIPGKATPREATAEPARPPSAFDALVAQVREGGSRTTRPGRR
ncbi:hypothetical protein [Bosea beijingensis]|uniref:hypothetical protein n=1 Tax=Bosea beijingensis TaxID=3068632 RepID=UPI002741D1CB|nr:hypothetical protein [Bosea sp. REN20]